MSGNNNTAIGSNALFNLIGNGGNIGIGSNAGFNVVNGDGNIFIGSDGVYGDTQRIRIGSSQSKTFIAGIRGTTTGFNNAIPVVIDSSGQLGTVSSSRRYKENIMDMGDVSSRLHALRPVTFNYKKPYANGEKPVQFGLIAEEVAETFPELAVMNEQGLPETVKYQDLTPLLLNEFQKQQDRITAMTAEMAELRQAIRDLQNRPPR